MARGCSGSDSDEEERHDRFKSERNQPSSVKPGLRTLPTSLDDYSSRSRSNLPLNDRYRSKNSSESFLSRRDRSKDRKRSRERKLSRERERNSGSSEEKRHKKRSSHEKDKRSDYEKSRYEINSKKLREKDENIEVTCKERDRKCKDEERKRRSREKERDLDSLRKREIKDEKNNKFEKISSGSDSDYLKDDEIVNEKDHYNEVENHTLPRYYEIVDECADSEGSHPKTSPGEKCSRKHKRSRDKSQNHHESKKRKKEKKHKRKHDKKKNEDANNVANTATDENLSLPTDIIILDNESDLIVDTNLSKCKKSDSDHEEGEISGSESEQYFGPALPPSKVTVKKMSGSSSPTDEDQYGPALPPTITSAGDETMEEVEEEQLEGEDIIGPLPVGQESHAQAALDIRASLLKKQMDNKAEPVAVKREEWMTELPDAKRTQLGLGPRKFRAKAAPDMSDRSSWSDTPKDKARKQLAGVEEELDTNKLEIAERNKEMELLAKKSEKKEKSLLESHQKELKKKKKREEKERGESKPERRPFSRELDLQTNKFDEAQKRSIIKKAQLLDSRFSSGESKFL